MYSYEKRKQLIYLNSTMKVLLLLNENWDILIAKHHYVHGSKKLSNMAIYTKNNDVLQNILKVKEKKQLNIIFLMEKT